MTEEENVFHEYQYHIFDSDGKDVTNVIEVFGGKFVDREKSHLWALVNQGAKFSLLYPDEEFIVKETHRTPSGKYSSSFSMALTNGKLQALKAEDLFLVNHINLHLEHHHENI